MKSSLDCSFHYRIYKVLCGAFPKIFYGNFERMLSLFPLPSAGRCQVLVIVVLLLVVVIVLVVLLLVVVVIVLLVVVVIVVAGYIQVTAASQLCRSALSYVSGLNSAHREKEDD